MRVLLVAGMLATFGLTGCLLGPGFPPSLFLGACTPVASPEAINPGYEEVVQAHCTGDGRVNLNVFGCSGVGANLVLPQDGDQTATMDALPSVPWGAPLALIGPGEVHLGTVTEASIRGDVVKGAGGDVVVSLECDMDGDGRGTVTGGCTRSASSPPSPFDTTRHVGCGPFHGASGAFSFRLDDCDGSAGQSTVTSVDYGSAPVEATTKVRDRTGALVFEEVVSLSNQASHRVVPLPPATDWWAGTSYQGLDWSDGIDEDSHFVRLSCNAAP